MSSDSKTKAELTAELEAARARIEELQGAAGCSSNPVARQKLERYKVFLENSPLGMILFNDQGAIVDCNDKFVEQMGSSRGKLIGFNTAEKSDPKMRQSIRQALAGETSVYEDFYTSVTGGKTIYLRVVFNPVHPGNSPTEVIATLEDFTRRRQTEEKMESLARRLAEAQRIAGMGDWDWNQETDTVTWSENLYALFGLNPAEPPPSYKGQLALYHPEDAVSLDAAVKRALEHGEAYELEMRRTMPNGEQKALLLRGLPRFDAGGKLSGLYGTVLDITKRKQAEENYKDLSRLLRGMADNLPDLVWAKDIEGRYLFANKAICEMLLKAEDTEEPLGRTDLFFALRERDAGHDHTFGEMCFDSDGITLNSLKASRFLEDGLVRGEYLALEVHKAPFYDAKGNLIGTVGAGRDVTTELEARRALSESEERFRSLYENAPVGIFQSTPNGQYLNANRQLARIYGYDALEDFQREITDISEQIYLNPRDRNHLLQTLERDGSVVNWETGRRKRNGEIIWTSTTMREVRDVDGSLMHYDGFTTDVTERKKTREALTRAKAQAEAASKAKSLFLANMSHELRTPLNGIMGMHQLLNTTPLNDEQQKYVETAISSAKRLTTLLSDILDLSKVEAGKMEVLSKPFKLDETLMLVEQLFRSSCEQKGIDLEIRQDPDMPESLLGDSARLQQILNNLVGNAVKFTEKGGIRLEALLAGAPDSRSVTVRFEVQDTGIGMPEGSVESLFDSFTQGEAGLTRKYQGAGLGLAIVRQLVTIMGGDIEVESKPGQGATFRVTIDFGLGEVAQILVARGQKICRAAAGVLEVLVVEDDSVSRFSAQRHLEKMGCRVTIAGNGKESLDLLAKGRFDLVLMDIQLPLMDGVEATRNIREGKAGKDNAEVPIIAMTAYAMAGEKEKFLAAGMNGYVSKPLEVEDLQKEMVRVVGFEADLDDDSAS